MDMIMKNTNYVWRKEKYEHFDPKKKSNLINVVKYCFKSKTESNLVSFIGFNNPLSLIIRIIDGSKILRKPKQNQEKFKSVIAEMRKAKKYNKKYWNFF